MACAVQTFKVAEARLTELVSLSTEDHQLNVKEQKMDIADTEMVALVIVACIWFGSSEVLFI